MAVKKVLVGTLAAIGSLLVIGSIGLALLGSPADDVVADDSSVTPPRPVIATNAPEPAAPPAATQRPPVVAEAPRLTVGTLRVRRAEALTIRQAIADAAVVAETAKHQRYVDAALSPERDDDFAADRRPTATEHRIACVSGLSDGCASLAKMYEGGDGAWADEPLAFSLNFIACQGGSDQGCRQFSRSDRLDAYDYQGSLPQIAHFKRRCEEDHAESCAALALKHKYGSGGVTQDEALAATLYQKACDLDDPASCAEVGDDATALALFQAACAADDGAACVGLAGYLGRNGEDIQSLEAARKACDLGAAHGCSDAARRYAEGDGALADADLALEYRVKSCDLGRLSSCMAAAKAFETGEGIAIDLERADTLYGQVCAVVQDYYDGCGAQSRIRMAAMDIHSSEVDAPLTGNPDAAAARQACTDGNGAACTDLGKMHRAALTDISGNVATGLFAHACTLGDSDGCTFHLNGQRGEDAKHLATQLCEAGDEAGCLWIARFDLALDGATRFDLLETGCAAGQPSLCHSLGGVLLNGGQYFGHDVPVDVERALALSTRACDGGHGGGCATLGHSKDPDINNDLWDNVPKDAMVAHAHYEQGCDLNDPWACQMLGYVHTEGATTVAQWDEAYEVYRKSCMLSGDCEDMQRAAIMRDRAELKGEHGMLGAALLERYDDFAAPYHGRVRRARRDCSAGQADGCILLGHYYYWEYASGSSWGLLYNAPDREFARALYLQACELGDMEGCWIYADSHTGIGDETDYDTALIYFTRACDAGHGRSCQSAGYLHELDKDDEATAGLLYVKGCDLGDLYACESLGGINDIENEALVADYQLRACLNADGLSCEFLAGDYRAGRNGLLKNIDIAKQLLGYGCEDGDEDSCAFLARIGGE